MILSYICTKHNEMCKTLLTNEVSTMWCDTNGTCDWTSFISLQQKLNNNNIFIFDTMNNNYWQNSCCHLPVGNNNNNSIKKVSQKTYGLHSPQSIHIILRLEFLYIILLHL